MYKKHVALALCGLLLLCLRPCGAGIAEGSRPSLIRMPAPGDPSVIACVGDSLTFGSGLADHSTQSYPAQLGALLGSDYTVRNFGVGGATVQPYTDVTYASQPSFAKSTACRPDAVLLMLGTNDADSRTWLGKERFLIEYRKLIRHYSTQPREAVVYLMTPPASEPGREFSPRFSVPILLDIAQAVRDEAAQQGLPLIDVYAATADHPEYYLDDGIHLNVSGYAALAQVVLDSLRSGAAAVPPHVDPTSPPLQPQPTSIPRLVPVLKKYRQLVVSCVGDSLTLGVDLDDPKKDPYPAQLGKLLGKKCKVINFGFGGAKMQKRCYWSYWNLTQFKKSVECKPNIVLLMLGTNDSFDDTWLGHCEFVRDYREMVKHYQDLPSHPAVYVMTPASAIPPAGQTELSYGMKSDMLANVAQVVRDMAAMDGLPLIDVYAATEGHPEYFLSDGIHLNVKGNKRLAELVRDSLALDQKAN